MNASVLPFQSLWMAWLTLAVMALSGAEVAAQAMPQSGGRTVVKTGAKLGVMSPSRFRVDGAKSNTGAGLSGGILFDYPVSRRFLCGLTVDLHDLHVYEMRKKMLDLGLATKFAIPFERQDWALRFVAGAGFAYMTKADFLERTTYLTMKLGMEGAFSVSSKASFLTDLLIFAAPVGGNRDHRATIGPTLIARCGFVY